MTVCTMHPEPRWGAARARAPGRAPRDSTMAPMAASCLTVVACARHAGFQANCRKVHVLCGATRYRRTVVPRHQV